MSKEVQYLTLTPDTVGTITLSNDARELEIVNFSGNDAIYFIVVDQDQTTDPTVLGTNVDGIPAIVAS